MDILYSPNCKGHIDHVSASYEAPLKPASAGYESPWYFMLPGMVVLPKILVKNCYGYFLRGPIFRGKWL